ncbi:tRNA pseudouridine(13) synthase TruD [Chiayiivirga flava]|uniref:tRNA pseudouridine synthase D n=1 Tax=Chiayiivirga flava TaxID=659595 RepID=A0A7W8DB62_9GAMM|nr:tRNA pseudouridine(13) synthase TruD [Chiayiivirga flava]MBB5209493.1 tRNA pseudouridine13 synthase [Chiayiivirga flava]
MSGDGAAFPRAHGPAVLRARMRTQPEDFVVEEDLGFAPSGAGEHLFLVVEKRGANTAWVAQQLARWAGVAPFAVSYAGLKDRHAVTRQAFTVHLPKRQSPSVDTLQHPDFRLLVADWHARKLPKGALRGNRFTLRLRGVHGEHAAVDRRLAAIAALGVPNAFGEQRFGRGGGNLDQARAMFAGRRVQRETRSILLSAARSAIFNAVLAERIDDGSWARGLDGEVWMLDGTHSVFGPEPMDEALRARAAALDIHPTGPLWGEGEPRCTGAVRGIELAVAACHPDLVDGLAAARLKHERRSLRLPVRELAWSWAGDTLELRFWLQAGAYATTVLHALGDIADAQAAADAGTAAAPGADATDA